jgi:glutamate formiminotransferase
MNLIDVAATPLHRVVLEVERLAAEHGTSVLGGELVGLMPASVAASAAGAALQLPGLAPDRVLEIAAGGEFGRGDR